MFVEQLINGLAIGTIYALVAVGYSLVFGILRLVNFTHSSVYTLGAFMVYVGVEYLHLNIFLAILFSLVTTGFAGVMIDKMGLEPLRKKGASKISAMITTIGLSYIIINCLNIAFGSQIIRFPDLFNYGTFKLLGATIAWQQVIIGAVALILLVALSIFINRTRIGLAMRAVQQEPSAAAINGINVNMIISLTFFLGAASAAIAGTLIASYNQYLRSSMGDIVGLKAFAAAVLGGIGSLPGSVLGGLIIGVSESMAVYKLGGSYIDMVAFSLLFLVLLIRPYGILGRKGSTKV
ncbi:MAG TPA: branched-chain amino acid ABC transporter permease [Ruminiclostridium sp.]|nr:branched-chain amino acid ABC transporter permease [Ruminiclostridium sp.]